jgi:hypothetical protein
MVATFPSLPEIINNRNCYYRSSVGGNYSHFTDEGKVAVMEYIELMAYKIHEAEQADLERRAKEQVLKELQS